MDNNYTQYPDSYDEKDQLKPSPLTIDFLKKFARAYVPDNNDISLVF